MGLSLIHAFRLRTPRNLSSLGHNNVENRVTKVLLKTEVPRNLDILCSLEHVEANNHQKVHSWLGTREKFVSLPIKKFVTSNVRLLWLPQILRRTWAYKARIGSPETNPQMFHIIDQLCLMDYRSFLGQKLAKTKLRAKYPFASVQYSIHPVFFDLLIEAFICLLKQ